MEGCKQFRVISTEEWVATHNGHGAPRRQPNEHQPPAGTYRLITLICPCGAKHVINESAATGKGEVK